MKSINWLGIETSCDDTSIAIVRNGKEILSNLISSQVSLHEKYGGIVPELASRKHFEVINPLIECALCEARLSWKDLDGVSVSYGPGLIGSLIIGVTVAKTIAGLLKLPLLGINHLEGHIYANFIQYDDIGFPCICLLVSGGHTALILMEEHGVFTILGETRDDAAGECFDKAARILDLSYPGGPEIDSLAITGNKKAFSFPRAYLPHNPFEFSFSGLKTSMMYFIKSEDINKHKIEDICASFQAAIIDVLVKKTMKALETLNIKRLLLAGGVACNSELRKRLAIESEEKGIKLFCPPPSLCTDNAAMIACTAHHYFKKGGKSDLTIDAFPNLICGS